MADHCCVCVCDQAGALTNPLDVAKTRLQTQMMVLDESSSSVGTRVASSAHSAEFQVLTNADLIPFVAHWIYSVVLVRDVRSCRPAV